VWCTSSGSGAECRAHLERPCLAVVMAALCADLARSVLVIVFISLVPRGRVVSELHIVLAMSLGVRAGGGPSGVIYSEGVRGGDDGGLHGYTRTLMG
jgi:hypothetical protein